ncbi:MAG TPA: alpha/beta hydrolase [Beijerinckiaceae bacterium]|nr:alpha/beta hydrolase [Beijerinckiaceae bacterium]
MPNILLPTGTDLYFETHGEGEPVVLIPSTGFSCEAWKPSQMPLAGSSRLILHDPRGCGRSRAKQSVYTIQQMANDVVTLLDHLSISAAHLVGHSMGGRIALEMALNFPGRTKSLIMAASGSGQVPRPGADCVPGVPHWLLTRMVEHGYEQSLREEYTDTTAFFTDDYRRDHAAEVEAFFQRVYPTHAKLNEYAHLVIARHNWEATHRLGDVSCPTMVLIGDHDSGRANHVAQAQAMQARIPGSVLEVLSGHSHGFPWQAPDETNRVILDWVAAHARQP